jgi:predicted site-specific integrase-resolvase
MNEINPDNELLTALRDQWQKLCAMVMSKTKQKQIRINRYDIQKLEKMFDPHAPAVVVHVEKANTTDEEIVLDLIDMPTAEKMASDWEKRTGRN